MRATVLALSAVVAACGGDLALAQVAPTQTGRNLDANLGDSLVLERDGQEIRVTVEKISDTGLTLDANNPLAGKDLVFEIEILEIA